MSSLFAEIRTGAAEGFGLGGGYFLGGGTAVRQPVGGVPQGGPASARLPNRPGQSIPEGQSPLPASSQKPGNREGNQRIPYARFMYTWPQTRLSLVTLWMETLCLFTSLAAQWATEPTVLSKARAFHS